MRMRRMKMTIPTTALLDADIIAYKAACFIDNEGVDELESRLDQDVINWTPDGIDDVTLAFSCSRKKNYRRDFWPSYKSHRDATDSPDSLSMCREYLTDTYPTLTEPRLEADDILGIYVSRSEMIGVTIDKDLKCIPGYHWNPDKDKDIRHVSEGEADIFFLIQWMAGDATDGIPGLWRIGPKKAEKFLEEWAEEDWEQSIIDLYGVEKYYPKGGEVDPLAMARCVRILRDGDYDFKTKEIKLWCPMVGYNENKE
jgi:DNA polymerase-1